MAVRGLLAGDCSRLEPLFQPGAQGLAPVAEWHPDRRGPPIDEPGPRHVELIDVPLAAGANANELPHKTGNKDADQRLRRHRGL